LSGSFSGPIGFQHPSQARALFVRHVVDQVGPVDLDEILARDLFCALAQVPDEQATVVDCDFGEQAVFRARYCAKTRLNSFRPRDAR
jgi:hypothetical protein